MDTLQITKESAIKAHNEANEKGRRLLENLFGKNVFQRKVTDRIKTFLDAAAEVEVPEDMQTLLSYKGIIPDMIAARAFTKLQIIARALNEGWQPDWDNSNEYKYYPWFSMSPSGFRYDDCVSGYAGSIVGSRLCFKSAELAEYAGKQFLSLYKDFMTIQ